MLKQLIGWAAGMAGVIFGKGTLGISDDGERLEMYIGRKGVKFYVVFMDVNTKEHWMYKGNGLEIASLMKTWKEKLDQDAKTSIEETYQSYHQYGWLEYKGIYKQG